MLLYAYWHFNYPNSKSVSTKAMHTFSSFLHWMSHSSERSLTTPKNKTRKMIITSPINFGQFEIVARARDIKKTTETTNPHSVAGMNKLASSLLWNRCRSPTRMVSAFEAYHRQLSRVQFLSFIFLHQYFSVVSDYLLHSNSAGRRMETLSC